VYVRPTVSRSRSVINFQTESFLTAFRARLPRYTFPIGLTIVHAYRLVDIPEKSVAFERAEFVGRTGRKVKAARFSRPVGALHVWGRTVLLGVEFYTVRHKRSAYVDGNHLINRINRYSIFRPNARVPFCPDVDAYGSSTFSRFAAAYRRPSNIHAIKCLQYFLECIGFERRFENDRVSYLFI